MTSAGMILVKADDEGQGRAHSLVQKRLSGIATPVRRLTGAKTRLFSSTYLSIYRILYYLFHFL